MKRIFLSLLFAATIASAAAENTAPMAKPYFDAAQEFFTNYSMIVREAKQKGCTQDHLNYLKEQQTQAQIAVAIANADIKTLQETPAELLASEGYIIVEESRFIPDDAEHISKRCFGAENALGFVLLHALDDKTKQDHANTIAMLNVMFSKKLNPYGKIGFAYFDKEGRDYVSGNPSILEMAQNITKTMPSAQKEEIYQLIRTYSEQPEIKALVPEEPEACKEAKRQMAAAGETSWKHDENDPLLITAQDCDGDCNSCGCDCN